MVIDLAHRLPAASRRRGLVSPRPGGLAPPALRVLRLVEPHRAGAGRLRISGRMADVCAELDRLAALEACAA